MNVSISSNVYIWKVVITKAKFFSANNIKPGIIRQTCQSEERADVTKLKAITKSLDSPTNGRKDHNQVADCVPCTKTQNTI